MKAMILAAGQGTRLRPLTEAVPKPMVPLVGMPLLERTLRWLSGQGVTEAAINLYHRPQAIPEYFGSNYAGLRLHYSFEDELLGTSGGVKAMESLFRDAPFYVIYGDNLIWADLSRLSAFHSEKNAAATVALFHHPNPSAAGIVATDADGRITRFVEKPPPNQIFSDRANAGIYVLSPSVLDSIPAGVSDFGKDIFPALLSKGLPLYGTLLNGYLQDTGTPTQYRQANWDLLAGLAGVMFPDPNLWLGEGATLGANVILEGRNVIGRNAHIGAGASLRDCIVWDNAKVGAGAHLTEAVLGYGASVPSGATVPPGTLLADNSEYKD